MAKIIANAFNLKNSSTSIPFTDFHADYKNYCTALYENGITTGKTTTAFDGASNVVTRGQLAAFVIRAEKAAAETKDEVTFTISEIAGNTVIGGNAKYQVAPELQGFLGYNK